MSMWPFNQAFVINLDRDTERLAYQELQLLKLDIPFERFAAINIRESTIDKSQYIQEPNRLKLSEQGCLLSHVHVWHEAKRRGLDWTLIFEDDAITHLHKEVLQTKINQVFRDHTFDVLYLGKCLDRCKLHQSLAPDYVETKAPLCLHAYIIRQAAIDKLLAGLPTQQPIDVYVSEMIRSGQLKAVAFHPSLFSQDTVCYDSNLRSNVESCYNLFECREVTLDVVANHVKYYGQKNGWLILLLIFILLIAFLILLFLRYR